MACTLVLLRKMSIFSGVRSTIFWLGGSKIILKYICKRMDALKCLYYRCQMKNVHLY